MSRSIRKPFLTFCGGSNKDARSKANRKFRRLTKRKIKKFEFSALPMLLKEVSDVWDFPTDGLAHYNPTEDYKFLRK